VGTILSEEVRNATKFFEGETLVCGGLVNGKWGFQVYMGKLCVWSYSAYKEILTGYTSANWYLYRSKGT